MDNDISLFKLVSAFTLSTIISTVNLPVQGSTVPDGVYASVTGWGSTIVSIIYQKIHFFFDISVLSFS